MLPGFWRGSWLWKRKRWPELKILVDENLSPRIADFLKDQGHDVVLVRDECRGAVDEVVVGLAFADTTPTCTRQYFKNESKDNTILLVVTPQMPCG